MSPGSAQRLGFWGPVLVELPWVRALRAASCPRPRPSAPDRPLTWAKPFDEANILGGLVVAFRPGWRPLTSRSVPAAMRAALPVTYVWREAVVGPPSGVRSVSESSTRTRSKAGQALRRRSFAARVTRPWPISAADVRTSAVPSSYSSTSAEDLSGRAAAQAGVLVARPIGPMPAPSRGAVDRGRERTDPARGVRRRSSSSTRSRQSSRPALSRSTWPVLVADPTRKRVLLPKVPTDPCPAAPPARPSPTRRRRPTE